jgi:hypothetical protein
MPLPPYVPQTKGEILEVHSSVFLFAPDNFSKIPGVAPEDQRTLESAFAELHRGVDHVYRQPRHEAARKRMHDMLDTLYGKFKANDVNGGRIMCHDFRDLITQTRP